MAFPVWPAAERNKQPILEVIQRVLPSEGLVLEVASATGQHIEHFARALPALVWQPSDYDDEHLATLAQRVAHADLLNLRQPIQLDATAATWPLASAHAIYNANMVHISPWEVTLGLFAGASRLLPGGAVLITYGPYSIAGEHTSESNAAFDASLKSRNPAWGVRDIVAMSQVARATGFTLQERVAMPANNFTLIWRKA